MGIKSVFQRDNIVKRTTSMPGQLLICSDCNARVTVGIDVNDGQSVSQSEVKAVVVLCDCSPSDTNALQCFTRKAERFCGSDSTRI